ncbi:MAG: antibiotic biosynthesis monooxygenase [Holophagaceae bacterium]|jgi:quinol monooxygenase YgiN|uniref:Antibiotic biosynthesis monooxygenase n=1 Tax=Candidatus Geothrix odensensis TaxID=2954440 RepID=A0A936F268_9BACT|nr:antibiotic biosynthesis monooxygenase [Candidatus Geothrix odensensis]
MPNIVVVVRYIAQPGKALDALTSVRDLVATVLTTEMACSGIEILQDLDNPESITLVERWPDKSTFLGPHMQQPHIQAFIQSAGAFLAGPPDISFHSTTGAA